MLEVNCHPLGLSVADKISLPLGRNAAFPAEAIDRLARFLVARVEGGSVALLAPDCFRIDSSGHRALRIGIPKAIVSDDSRVDLFVEEFNALAQSVRSLMTPCWITDTRGVSLKGHEIYLTNGERVGALLRRAAKFPRVCTETFCVNDLRTRFFCSDKLSTYRALLPLLGHDHLVETLPWEPEDPVAREAIRRLTEQVEYILTKPTRGAGSVGVERWRADTLMERLTSPRRQRAPLVCQPWIEPESVDVAGASYHYDIRLYLLGGEPFAGVARRAAAARDGAGQNTSLAWLTTGGPLMPLSLARRGNARPAVRMARPLLQKMCQIARAAVLELDRICAAAQYDRIWRLVPSFAQANGLQGRIRPLSLPALSSAPL